MPLTSTRIGYTRGSSLSPARRRFARLVVTVPARCASRPAPTQTLHRSVVGGAAGRGTVHSRPDFLRFGYDVNVFLPGRQSLFQRQPPAPVSLLFAQTTAATVRAAVAAQTARRRWIDGVRETPQEYAAVRARAHYGPAVRAHFHVGHDARVADAHVSGHPFVVQPHLNHLIRTPGHNVLSCVHKNTRFC